MDTNIITQLQLALQQPLPGINAQKRMSGRIVMEPTNFPTHARASAVLCLLFPHEDELSLLLIRRTEDGQAHSGQISFPGGKQEPTDSSLKDTALRETAEEVGLAAQQIQLIGSLTQLYISISNFTVSPFVGYTDHRPKYQINKREVAEVLEIPISRLFMPSIKTITQIHTSSALGTTLNVPAYMPNERQIIWGATAMIISELEAILKFIPPAP